MLCDPYEGVTRNTLKEQETINNAWLIMRAMILIWYILIEIIKAYIRISPL